MNIRKKKTKNGFFHFQKALLFVPLGSFEERNTKTWICSQESSSIIPPNFSPETPPGEEWISWVAAQRMVAAWLLNRTGFRRKLRRCPAQQRRHQRQSHSNAGFFYRQSFSILFVGGEGPDKCLVTSITKIVIHIVSICMQWILLMYIHVPMIPHIFVAIGIQLCACLLLLFTFPINW